MSRGRHRGNGKRDQSRKGELQRLLGEHGTIRPRQAHGTPERPAAGWYADMHDGRTVYLGDYSALAVQTILWLLDEPSEPKPRAK